MARRGLGESSLASAPPPAPVPALYETPSRLKRPPLGIRASRGWVSLGLREVWGFRGLLFMLAWRDVKVRYKQTSLGFGWAIIPPVLNMLAFSLIFGGLAKIPSQGRPYPLWSYAGLLPWLFFAQGVTRGSGSLVGSSGIVSKVYFPRLIVPIAAVLTPLADFFFSMLVLVGLMGYYGIGPGWGALALPGLVLLAFATALSVALWLAALNVRYRDVGFGVAFAIQFWMYLSPVIYPVTLVPHNLRLIYALNPMTGVVEGFRWGLLGLTHPDFGVMAVSTAVVAVLLFGGLIYFKRTERTFVDVL
jgi:lipopolysaccharide transport system permease protein